MAIISQETFEKMTKEEKESIKSEYLKWQEEAETNPYFEGKISNMEDLFGKENLQPENKIKTWKDIEEYYTNVDMELGNATKSLYNYSQCPIQLLTKCIATLKIAKLIELGYGGIVTKEEWGNKDLPKWYIVPGIEGKLVIDSSYENWQEFAAFHSPQQAEEFMSHPENRKLVEQYYMI